MSQQSESSDLPPPLTVSEARRHILELVEPLQAQRLLLTEARGRILAEPVIAPTDSPAWDNSAMDGYAVRWDDLAALEAASESDDRADGVELPVVGEVPAGPAEHLREWRVGAGQAARIMTGARLPDGADTVIMREDTEELGDRVIVRALPKAGKGANIRRRGTYFAADQPLVQAGQLVDPGLMGLLASVGVTAVSVYRRPRVAVIATGDELVEVYETPGSGQIRNSSAYMLAGLIDESGGEPVIMPIARDTVAHCRACFEAALGAADLIVSIGGVSVGDYDIVRNVMTELDAGMRFWKVKIKPGKPLAFGITGDVPLIGLPGNPVSSFVAFYQFVRPAMLRQSGATGEGILERVTAKLTAPVRSPSWRADYQRGTLRPTASGWDFEPFPDQGSGNLTSIVNTSGLAVIPEGLATLPAGQLVEVERLPTAIVGEPRANREEREER